MAGKKSLKGFTEEDKEVLVRIVKAAQGRNIRGSKGDWKEFLKATDKKLGAAMSDPAKRPWQTLAAFVRTLTTRDGIEMVSQIRSREKRIQRFERSEVEGLWGDSREQKLVKLTLQHRRYKELYALPFYEKGWVMTDLRKGDDCDLEDILSIDCEMVLCEDGQRELVHVCAVNSQCEVILDSLVKPTKRVVDYLTPITGICQDDMESVTCRFTDAQTAVLDLLSCNTILVGHGLHNDLKALKIDHLRVIDTSLVFAFRNRPETYSPGLNDLCKTVLGYEFRHEGKPHSCLEDARIPMRIVLHVLEHGLQSPIDMISTKKLDESSLSKFYLHGIPSGVSVTELLKIFPRQFDCKIEPISRVKEHGATYASFNSSDEANKAFEQLDGILGQDSYGRLQKTVSFTSGTDLKEAAVRVRKMVSEMDDHGAQLPTDTAVRNMLSEMDEDGAQMLDDRAAGNHASSKKKRKLSDPHNSDVLGDTVCCGHLKELEMLRQLLKEKTEEVESLQRIIVSLTLKERR